MTTIAPLTIQPRLAGNPKAKPQYAVPVQLSSGETLMVADPKATRAMISCMDMNATHGGAASHFGGPSAFAELMSATHGLMFHSAAKSGQAWYDLFHFVNDAGHCENGIYALKANYGFAGLNVEQLKGFRSIESKLTGHGEAHLFPEGVLVSNGPLGSGLPQSQGLAFADSITGKKRITVCALSDGAAMEGEAKEALAAIPGLARKGKMAPFVLLISDNRTKLSGRIEQDSFNMELTFDSLEKLGWKVIHLENGNHLQACVSTLEEAFAQASQDASTPVAILARTIKGKGNKKAEASATGAHGFPLKKASELTAFLTEIYDGAAVPQEFISWTQQLEKWESAEAEKAKAAAPSAAKSDVPAEKIQIGVSNAMIKAREKGLPIFSVSADLQGSTGVAEFHKKFPEASLDVGIAESNMISTAAGLSLEGFIPFVDTFAQFGVTKGALPITMANLSLAPVIGIFSHIGFQDAADGASHQAVSFFAQVSSIPHVEAYSLSSSSEAEALITQAIESFAADRKAGKVPPTRIFFLGRENFPRHWGAATPAYKLAQAPVLFDTTSGMPVSVTFVVSGSLVGEAEKAVKALKEKSIGALVVHASCINHPDVATVSACLKKTGGRLVTNEEHRVVGGMGAMLTHALVLNGERLQVKSLGLGDHFGQSAYLALELYQKHGMDSIAMVRAATELLK